MTERPFSVQKKVQSKNLWFTWLLATVGGWALGLLASGLFTLHWIAGGHLSEAVGWPMAGLVLGAFIGIAQWCVLRRLLCHAIWWIWDSALGMALGGMANELIGGETALLVAGIATGILQYLLLRHQVHGAGWWTLTSAIVLPLSFAFGIAAAVVFSLVLVKLLIVNEVLIAVVAFLVCTVTLAAITGVVLIRLLQTIHETQTSDITQDTPI